MPFIRCRVGHCYGCVKLELEFNDTSWYTKVDFEQKGSIIFSKFKYKKSYYKFLTAK